MKIPISEIFESIQGEGRNTGKPSIFVRFWGCNLECSWCDSEYSWKAKVEKANIMTLEEIVNKIQSFKSKHIIFTGGEPTLYQNQMRLIIDQFPSYTFELETNGSKQLDDKLFQIGCFEQINISPKLKSSGNKEYNLNILKNISYLSDYIDLKFVCSNIIDTKETDNYIKNINIEDIDDIYIMPLGRDSKSQVNDYLLKYCISKGYKYCLRQHLILFGDGKGK